MYRKPVKLVDRLNDGIEVTFDDGKTVTYAPRNVPEYVRKSNMFLRLAEYNDDGHLKCMTFIPGPLPDLEGEFDRIERKWSYDVQLVKGYRANIIMFGIHRPGWESVSVLI